MPPALVMRSDSFYGAYTKGELISKLSYEELDNGCWRFLGGLDKSGYGLIPLRLNGRKALRRAHNISGLVFLGWNIDGPLNGLHTCDNPSCINPDHLFQGTQKNNIEDARRKGRLRGREERDRKSHCANGHEYTKENSVYYAVGYRQCRECLRIRGREKYYRTKV
jgi:hypothetical protein